MKDTHVKKRVVTGTITITEKEPKRQRPEFSSMPVDQFCLMRSHMVAALVAFSLLSITQLFILLKCLHSYCSATVEAVSPEDTISCSSSGCYVSSQCYSSSVEDISRALAPNLHEQGAERSYHYST
ncbi:hypothetical protein GCK32_009668 [Trichostrongylus colubriformis]|uniref:Uncharacterized protein n=1 Tax=Trichostrongylus colubriformis TaxID=6319 RepID=A0AAN8FVK3_TRICO